MSGGLHWLPWYPASFLSATRGWSVTAKGVYRELLDAQWELGVLPDDPAALRRLIGASEQEWSEGWRHCAAKFEVCDGGLRNRRLEDHRAESTRLRDRRAEGARRTNAKLGRTVDADAQRSPSLTLSVTPSETLSVSPLSLQLSPPLPSGVLEDSDSRPQQRTRERPAYESSEFHQQVVAAYHELLPMLPKAKQWGADRQRALNARIRERLKDGKPADSLDYWRSYFALVARTPFLTGESGERSWRCHLDWLLKPANFRKVAEGVYSGPGRGNGAVHAP